LRTKEIISGVHLFQQGYKLTTVARKLKMPLKSAKQLQRIYWQTEAEIEMLASRHITDIYFKETEEDEARRGRQRIVEAFLNNLPKSQTWKPAANHFSAIDCMLAYFPKADWIMIPLPDGFTGWGRTDESKIFEWCTN